MNFQSKINNDMQSNGASQGTMTKEQNDDSQINQNP